MKSVIGPKVTVDQLRKEIHAFEVSYNMTTQEFLILHEKDQVESIEDAEEWYLLHKIAESSLKS